MTKKRPLKEDIAIFLTMLVKFRDGGSSKEKFKAKTKATRYLPYNDFECEPNVANEFHVEEGIMWKGL